MCTRAIVAEAAGFALEGDLFYKWFEQKEGWGLSFSLSRMLTETISAQATLNLGFDGIPPKR